MIVGIIGAGASGMAAALAAAENPNAQVILLERQARVGRKLQATGNGRCNLTNLHSTDACLHGDHPEFSKYAMEQFPPQAVLRWFRSLGLFTVAEASGRVYPYSDQANSVVDVLRFALNKPNIQLLTGFEVSKIKKEPSGFLLESGAEKISCDRLIIACGGLAGTKLGGSMSGYKLLQKLGHHLTRLRPALVQLKSDWSGCVALKGVRTNCRAEILRDGQPFSSSRGELQFTEFGLSGPVMFEISRDACQGSGTWSCRLDFLPETGEGELLSALQGRRETALAAEELLTGILHNRLGRILTKSVGISAHCPICQLEDEELAAVCNAVKAFEIHLTESLGMDAAQVTAGGVLTAEFDEKTMESRLVPGLYACGEVLDIDGDCGGHNLQWAWSSGRLAGLSAGREDT